MTIEMDNKGLFSMRIDIRRGLPECMNKLIIVLNSRHVSACNTELVGISPIMHLKKMLGNSVE